MSGRQRATKHLRALMAMIEDEGCKAIGPPERRGKHYAVRVATDDGPRLLIVSATPSDQRAAKNSRAVLRRMMR